MSVLSLQLFGNVVVELNSRPLGKFRTNKVLALLIYLVTEPPIVHQREALMTLLWPDQPLKAAQTNLRQIIYQLRKTIPEGVTIDGRKVPLFLSERHSLQRNPQVTVQVDAVAFNNLLEEVHTHEHNNVISCPFCKTRLETAVQIYQGPFLADFYLDDSNEFEDWVQRHREAYHRQVMNALSALAKGGLQRGEYAQTQTYALRQLELDNLDEHAARQLMEALARDGRRSEALAVYKEATKRLDYELGIPPTGQTNQLAQQIENDTLQTPTAPRQAVRGYKLLAEIGAGAFGVVYHAYQPVIGRDVVIKIIRPRYANHPVFIRRFEAEAQTIARLEHPHIVPLYDYWREPNNAYLVMRRLRGGTLEERLHQGVPALDFTITMVDQIAAALFAAHRRHIIHSDVKPANILLDEDNNAYLYNFSLAKELPIKEESFSRYGSPAYIAPEQLLRAELAPQTDQYSLGIMIYQMLTGHLPFPNEATAALIRSHILAEKIPLVRRQVPDMPGAVDDVLQRATAKKPDDRFPDIITLARAFHEAAEISPWLLEVRGLPPRTAAVETEAALVLNPYKGLYAFQESDSGAFYGRESLVKQLLGRIGEEGQTARFLAIIGPSGSGKSSLVKAGLIPAIRAGRISGSHTWFITEMTPGGDPFEELATALMRVAVELPSSMIKTLQDDAYGLATVLGQILPTENDEGPQLLLLIDQFEELFTLTTDDDARELFIRTLLVALNDSGGRLRVIVTLRADFYDRPLQIPGLGELLRRRTEVVVPLTPAELEQAISRPAALAGVNLESGLTASITADVNDQPGSLPLMQYALTELFERRQNGSMTIGAYQEIGGVSGALGRRADEIFRSLNGSEQEAAQQLFLRLVTLGEGIEDTRRRVLRAELEALEISSGAEISRIIDTFGRYRLLTFDRDQISREPTVEVAHEALLREWPHLRTWLDTSRAGIRLQRLLAIEAAEWLAAGFDEGYLLRGSRLDQFQDWSGEANISLTADENAFLTASFLARQSRLDAEGARIARELQTAQQLAQTEHLRAEEQTASASKLRRRALLLAAAMVAAAVLALTAFAFARSSAQNALVAATRAAEANSNAGLAVENANLASTRQAEAAAQAGLASKRQMEAAAEADLRATAESEANIERDVALAREDEARESYSLSLAANARQALEADDQPLALLLALAANTVDNPPLNAWRTLLDVAYAPGAIRQYQASSPINTVEVSPNGQTVVSGSDDGYLREWNIAGGGLLRNLKGHSDAVKDLVFSPDGTKMLSGAADNKALLWDVASGKIELELLGHDNPVSSVVFLHDDRRALTGEDSRQLQGELILWDLESGKIIRRFGGDLEEIIEGVLSIAITPDGHKALVGYRKDSAFDTWSAVLWDIESGEVLHFLGGTQSSINSVDISPDGRLGYGAADDGSIIIWDLAAGEVVDTLSGHGSSVTQVKASPQGSTALSGALDGALIFWDLATQEPIARFHDHQDAVWDLSFQDEWHAVSGSADGLLYYWDLEGSWRLNLWREPGTSSNSKIDQLQISHDGQFALTESAETGPDGTKNNPSLTLWDYERGTPIRNLGLLDSYANDIAFMPDDQQALTADFDGSLSLWDLQTGQLLSRYAGHNGFVIAVDISSDGRYALSAGLDGQVIYHDLTTGEIIWRMTGHFEGHGLTDVIFLPGNRQAVSSSWDGTMILWDLATGEEVRRLTGVSGGVGGHLFTAEKDHWAVNQIAATTDGRQVLSTADDRTLLLWDLATGSSLLRFNGHSQPVYTVALTPDDRQALSNALDDPMILWDITTAKPIRQFPFHHKAEGGFSPVTAIHPSGLTALTNDVDGSIIKWQLAEPDPAKLIDWITDHRALRELTCLERETYRIEPLCEDGTAPSTTAEMLAGARQAAGTLVTDAAFDPAPTLPFDPQAMLPPERVPKVGLLGDNHGELVAGNFDIWVYEGKAGEILTMHMIADHPVTDPTMPLHARNEAGLLDTKLFIINPDGTILHQVDDEMTLELTELSDAHVLAVKLPVDGQYRIEARSTLDDQAGGYTLQIEQLDPVWNADLFAEYVGHYIEGPWQFETFIYIDDNRLLQIFAFGGEEKPDELIPIDENDFITGGGAQTVFTRDEHGNVNGYKILFTNYHNIAGQWYQAERLGDMPQEFLDSLNNSEPEP